MILQGTSSAPLPPLSPDTKIAIVRSSYYPELLSSMEETAKAVFQEGGISAENIRVIRAPGALEIPLLCKTLAATKAVQGILALGVIVQGETHHAAEVARACTDGILQVQLEFLLPIAHGVLYVDTLQHAKDRCLSRSNKGGEAARALLHLMGTMSHIREQ